ncbi:methylase involved in ubiquinone/menaquinone biosynthesis [Halovivax ruber XH-70]|uniref:Methylase involved in ubiquinone/menaquinone biosynthesis n=1 Tax=Halovivax ruber (strain DSM 18193 / JCM 13892 / XH-70) TaxID=797302 RepID=L0IB49_HALRX|nr:class I SAM-dependent methyltransferase [Halovivax ruber]AGB15461.1 methylase involved in ubiquinone/menaquinone biosynthesis [Halovivax ruber XH-70]
MTDTRAENRKLWEEWSEDFQALWNANTAEGEAPPAPCPFTDDPPGGSQPDLLPTVEGIDFVELGCGGGQGSVGTALEGADTVVGVDFSAAQLDHARHLRDHYGVDARFVRGDVTNLPLPDASFDVAFSGWVYQMVPDLEACLAEARRVLRDDGLLVFDVPHPMYERMDPETNTLTRSYHADPRREIVIDEDYEADMVAFDRKVSTLHNAAVAAGFDVQRLLEPGTADPDDYEDKPLESDRPDLKAMVPRTVRFWATAR